MLPSLINRALQKCDASQRAVLEANYAKGADDACEARVRAVYAELDISGEFRAYEEAMRVRIETMVARVHDMPSEIFMQLLRTIYKRQK